MIILLARHGNTFEAGATPVFIDSSCDLELTSEGIAQATRVGQALLRNRFIPDRILTSQLKRTRKFAAEIQRTIDSDVSLEERIELNEISMGNWVGRTTAEVQQLFGSEVYDNWRQKGVWPTNGSWTGSRGQVIAGIHGLFADILRSKLTPNKILLVSSNGLLRYCLSLAANEFAGHDGALNMRTGHLGVMRMDNGVFRVDAWNIAPEELSV